MTFDPRALLASLTTEQTVELASIMLGNDPLLNAYQVAAYCGVAPDLVYYWQKTGTGPAAINLPVGPRGDESKARTRLRWRQSVVAAWALVRQTPTKGFPNMSREDQHVVRYALGLESSPLPPPKTHLRIGELAEALSMPQRRLRRMQAAGRIQGVKQPEPGTWREYDVSVPLVILPPRKRRGNAGEVAKRLGISKATVIRWARKGRLVPTGHTPGGFRVFDLASLPSPQTAQRWAKRKLLFDPAVNAAWKPGE